MRILLSVWRRQRREAMFCLAMRNRMAVSSEKITRNCTWESLRKILKNTGWTEVRAKFQLGGIAQIRGSRKGDTEVKRLNLDDLDRERSIFRYGTSMLRFKTLCSVGQIWLPEATARNARRWSKSTTTSWVSCQTRSSSWKTVNSSSSTQQLYSSPTFVKTSRPQSFQDQPVTLRISLKRALITSQQSKSKNPLDLQTHESFSTSKSRVTMPKYKLKKDLCIKRPRHFSQEVEMQKRPRHSRDKDLEEKLS
jgi:hypothetical protein